MFLTHQEKKWKKNHSVFSAQLNFIKGNSLLVLLKAEYRRFSFSNDPEKQLTPEFSVTPTTPPVALNQEAGRSTQRRKIKILPQKQMLQRLPILLAQVQISDISKKLLSEIRQIVCSLY